MDTSVRQSKRILLVLDLLHTLWRQVLHGIAEYEPADGRWELVAQSSFQGVEAFRRGGFDGVIGMFGEGVPEELAMTKVPAVQVSTRTSSGALPRVWCDNAAVGRLAAEYLVGQGYRGFAYIGIADHYYSQMRGEAFVDALARAGRPCALFDHGSHRVSGNVSYGDAGRNFVRELRKPVAIFACNDFRAKHVASWCVDERISMPEDVAIVGVDNDEIQRDLTAVPLSSIELNGLQNGREAAKMLDWLMQAQDRIRSMSGSGGAASEGYVELPVPTTPVIPNMPLPLVLIPPMGVVSRKSSSMLAIEDTDVAEALRYIRAHATESISVDSILRHVPVSRRTLEMRFRKAIGRSPHEEISRLRIERAKELILQGEGQLADVARRCGFKYAHLFSASFRATTGMTPSAFRKQFMQKK